MPWVSVASALSAATWSVVAGTHVLMPTFIIANTICQAVGGRRRHRRFIVVSGVLALVVPVLLELTGVVPPAHGFVDGSLVVTSRVVELREPLATIFSLLVNLGLLLFASIYVAQFRDALHRAEGRNHLSLWQLKNLVPERVRAATSAPPPPSRR